MSRRSARRELVEGRNQPLAHGLDQHRAVLSLVDLMIVVGGRGSSNTKRLYQMCLDRGIAAEFIETADEIDESWFSQLRTVGLTTGTSTPEWVIDEVQARLDAISRDCGD